MKAEVAEVFLEAQNVGYQSSEAKRKLENTEVAAIGKAITVLVACRKLPSAADEPGPKPNPNQAADKRR